MNRKLVKTQESVLVVLRDTLQRLELNPTSEIDTPLQAEFKRILRALVGAGVATNSVTAKGFENALPVVWNDNSAGRQENRRESVLYCLLLGLQAATGLRSPVQDEVSVGLPNAPNDLSRPCGVSR